MQPHLKFPKVHLQLYYILLLSVTKKKSISHITSVVYQPIVGSFTINVKIQMGTKVLFRKFDERLVHLAFFFSLSQRQTNCFPKFKKHSRSKILTKQKIMKWLFLGKHSKFRGLVTVERQIELVTLPNRTSYFVWLRGVCFFFF